jgi:hypothetical protein
MRKTLCCILTLGLAAWIVVGAFIGAAEECTKCYDPPRDPWIRHSLTLEYVRFYPNTEPLDPLTGLASELVLLFEVTYLGGCAGCATTYVKYLPELAADMDQALTISVDEVVYTMAECWPPSKIAIRVAMFEEDFASDEEVWNLVKGTAWDEIARWTGAPYRNPKGPWSVQLSGAWFDQLASELKGEDVVMPETRWEYDHSRLRLPTGDWNTVWKYPTQFESFLEYKTAQGSTAVYFQLYHSYSQPSGVSCSAQGAQTETGETATLTPQPVSVPAVPTLPENVSSAARSLAWKSGRLAKTDPSARWTAREDRPSQICETCGGTPMCVVCMESDLESWQSRGRTSEETAQLAAVLSYLKTVKGQPEYHMMAALYWDSYWDGWHNRDAPG